MTRRAKGPKRRAEQWAYTSMAKVYANPLLDNSMIYGLMRDAWMAGYRAAARARRKQR